MLHPDLSRCPTACIQRSYPAQSPTAVSETRSWPKRLEPKGSELTKFGPRGVSPQGVRAKEVRSRRSVGGLKGVGASAPT